MRPHKHCSTASGEQQALAITIASSLASIFCAIPSHKQNICSGPPIQVTSLMETDNNGELGSKQISPVVDESHRGRGKHHQHESQMFA